MKRHLSLFLLIAVCLLTACQSPSASPANTEASTQTDSGNSDTASYMKLTADNVESSLRLGIYNSSFIVEGTLQGFETVKVEDGAIKPNENNIYTFGDLQVITGIYEEETLPITISQTKLKKFQQYSNYQIGERYILLVQSPDSVNYTGKMWYSDFGVLCKLNRNNPEKIDKLLLEDFPMETMLGTRQELINIVAEEVGLQNAYYNPCDQYVHSDMIADIVQGADVVAKVRIDTVDNEDNFFIIEECDCTLLELYKGEILTLKEGQFHFKPKRYSTKAGEEYLVLLQLYESTEPKLIDYGQAAKKNAIIPMTDTERVNEVYAALGIEPEA